MTAVLSPDEVHVWYCLADDPPWADVQQSYLSLLSADERSRYDRFMFDKDRRQFLLAQRSSAPCCHATPRPPRATGSSPPRRKASLTWLPASAWRTCNSTTRTPTRWWPAPSPARTRWVWTWNRWIEKWISGSRDTACPRSNCSSSTTPIRRTNRRFLMRQWTLKEAYSKARGLGLSLHFVDVSFSFDAQGRPVLADHTAAEDDPRQWQFHQWLIEGRHYLAVAVQCPADSALPIHHPPLDPAAATANRPATLVLQHRVSAAGLRRPSGSRRRKTQEIGLPVTHRHVFQSGQRDVNSDDRGYVEHLRPIRPSS